MKKQTGFDRALADFVNDMASGDAVRHLADSGMTVSEITARLSFPTEKKRVAEMVYEILRRNILVRRSEKHNVRTKRLLDVHPTAPFVARHNILIALLCQKILRATQRSLNLLSTETLVDTIRTNHHVWMETPIFQHCLEEVVHLPHARHRQQKSNLNRSPAATRSLPFRKKPLRSRLLTAPKTLHIPLENKRHMTPHNITVGSNQTQFIHQRPVKTPLSHGTKG